MKKCVFALAVILASCTSQKTCPTVQDTPVVESVVKSKPVNPVVSTKPADINEKESLGTY